jgi:hypothetical protein
VPERGRLAAENSGSRERVNQCWLVRILDRNQGLCTLVRGRASLLPRSPFCHNISIWFPANNENWTDLLGIGAHKRDTHRLVGMLTSGSCKIRLSPSRHIIHLWKLWWNCAYLVFYPTVPLFFHDLFFYRLFCFLLFVMSFCVHPSSYHQNFLLALVGRLLSPFVAKLTTKMITSYQKSSLTLWQSGRISGSPRTAVKVGPWSNRSVRRLRKFVDQRVDR